MLAALVLVVTPVACSQFFVDAPGPVTVTMDGPADGPAQVDAVDPDAEPLADAARE